MIDERTKERLELRLRKIWHRIRYPFWKTHILDSSDTLSTAVKVARRGDAIYLREGVYTEKGKLDIPAGVKIEGVINDNKELK